MSLPAKIKAIDKTRRRRADVVSLPPEILAAVVSLLGPRDHAAAVLASRRFGVLTPEERGRLHFARFAPKVLARAGSLQGLCYWHGVDPWRVDIHCLRAAAEAGHRALVEWILDESTGGGCPTEALCAAARGGHVDLMRWLIDERQAAILKEVLVDAISSKHTAAVCLVLDCARQADHREADTVSDTDGSDNDGDAHHDDPDSSDDDDDDAGDDGRCFACGRDWGERPMREAARTNDVNIMQLVYDRCYGDDPDILGRPLRAAAEAGAAAAVGWILARHADRGAAAAAFEAALMYAQRACAVAILSRWPDVACVAHPYPWHVERFDDVMIHVLDAALAVAAGERPDTWPMPDGAPTDPEHMYDALLAHCLVDEMAKLGTSRLASALLRQNHCKSLFDWIVDVAHYAPAVHDVVDLAREGMIDRLAYCLRRWSTDPGGIVAAMTAASAAGRVDVLDYVWSLVATDDHYAGAASAVRAGVQEMANAAAESGDWAVVEWLQRHIDRRAHCTAAAFSTAASKGHAAFLGRLYAVGADRCRHPCGAPCEIVPGWSPFLFALRTPCGLYDVNGLWRNVARSGHYDVVQVLRKHGVLDGVYLRSEAALNGHVAICALDVAVNGPCKRDLMIQYAVQARDRACLSFALANGSAWEPLGSWSVHPMRTAAKKGSRAIADLLAKHEAQIANCLSVDGFGDEESDFDSESD